MVSRVYTFLMTLGEKDLWNYSEGTLVVGRSLMDREVER